MHLNRLSLFIIIVFVLPIFALLSSAFFPYGDNLYHIYDTVLYDYFFNSLSLAIGVAFITFLLGASTAFLTSMYNFPLRRLITVMLILPLAIPPYINAITYSGILENYSAIDIHNLFGSVLMISFVVYPYVYLLARGAFIEQSREIYENSQVLGVSNAKMFFKVSLPLARPAIILGVTLSAMEALADYGTVEFLGVATFTTGIFRTWIGMGDTISAAQMATFFLTIVFIFVLIEQNTRRKIKYAESTKHRRKFNRISVPKHIGFIFLIICLIPLLFGFLIPFFQLLFWAFFKSDVFSKNELWDITFNSLSLATIGSVIIVLISLLFTYSQRLNPTLFLNRMLKVMTMGYAIPGPVIAIAVLVPFSYLDGSLNNISNNYFNFDIGLIFSGTFFVLIFAYCLRFSTISIRSLTDGFGKINYSIDETARLMGISERKILKSLHIPLLGTPLLTSFLIVFVDIMKELPLTSVLRPFNFNTLSVKAFELASDELIIDASGASIMIVFAGIIPIIFIMKNIYGKRNLL